MTWNDTDIKHSSKGIDIHNLIFKSKEKVKIIGLNSIIEVSAVLKGECSLWLYTRKTEFFTPMTAVIRVSKEDKSQRIYLSLGTFVKDKSDNFEFKIFTRQQLVDFESNLNYYIYVCLYINKLFYKIYKMLKNLKTKNLQKQIL